MDLKHFDDFFKENEKVGKQIKHIIRFNNVKVGNITIPKFEMSMRWKQC